MVGYIALAKKAIGCALPLCQRTMGRRAPLPAHAEPETRDKRRLRGPGQPRAYRSRGYLKGFTPETVRQIREYIKCQEEEQIAAEKPPDKEPASKDQASTQNDPAEKPTADSPQEPASIKKRRRKKRRKGKVPMNLRKSVLERLRRYQARISKKRENR